MNISASDQFFLVRYEPLDACCHVSIVEINLDEGSNSTCTLEDCVFSCTSGQLSFQCDFCGLDVFQCCENHTILYYLVLQFVGTRRSYLASVKCKTVIIGDSAVP